MDRRTGRTRRQLRDALFALMLEKGYEAVTIEDVTTRADLGRTTFYLHFRDKEDLLLESISSIAVELQEQIAETLKQHQPILPGTPAENLPARAGIRLVFENAAQNSGLYLPILKGEGTARAPAKIREIITEAVGRFFAARVAAMGSEVALSVPQEIITTYFASALMGVLTWWLEQGMPYSPDEVTEMFIRQFAYGARGLLGNTQ